MLKNPRQKGISVRRNWLKSWESLGLHNFDFYEIVPFNEGGVGESAEVELALDCIKGKPSWLHLTSVSLADDPDYFYSRVQELESVARLSGVSGVSVHFASDFINGTALPGPSAVLQSSMVSDNCKRNLNRLQQAFSAVAIENLSTAFGEKDLVSYLEFYADFLRFNGALALVDMSNLWNSASNAHVPVKQVLNLVKSLPVAYSHFGGSVEIENTWFDSHHEYPQHFNPDWLKHLPEDTPLVFEYDWQTWDLASSKKVIERALHVF